MATDHQRVERAVVVTDGRIDTNQATTRLALFTPSGDPINLPAAVPATPTGANVPMTGYAGHSAGDVVAADKVNDAIGKLEARIAALEAA